MKDIILIGAGIGKVYSSCSAQGHPIEVVEQKQQEIENKPFQKEPFTIKNYSSHVTIAFDNPKKRKSHQRHYKYHP
jgi:hypothetical protein